MSHRYDSRTTTFSPEGRLYQVEYAVEAIGQAGSALGIITTEGIVLATERHIGNALLDSENLEARNISGDKVFKLAGHLGCAVAGVTSDANILVNYARLSAARHEYQHQAPMPVEDLCRLLCDIKQGYTQYGGMRPFGVAFLIAGYDKYFGFRLYHTDPSGNYSSWEAFAIGEGDGTAQSLLKQHWHDKLTLHEGKVLAVRILQRTLDTANLPKERIEVATLTRQPQRQQNNILNPYTTAGPNAPVFAIVDDNELVALIEEADKERQKEEEEKAKKEAENERK